MSSVSILWISYKDGTLTKRPATSVYCDIGVNRISYDHYLTDGGDVGLIPNRLQYEVAKKIREETTKNSSANP